MKTTIALSFALLQTTLTVVDSFQASISRSPHRSLESRVRSSVGLRSATLELVDTAVVEVGEKDSIRNRRPLSLAGRWFQLECLECDVSTLTEVFLNPDGTAKVGKTEGPLFSNAWGHWQQDLNNGGFALTTTFEFQAGVENHNPLSHKIGEFTFQVERHFVGEFTFVGAKRATHGTVLSSDPLFGDVEVGHFHMIDITGMVDETQKRRLDTFI